METTLGRRCALGYYTRDSRQILKSNLEEKDLGKEKGNDKLRRPKWVPMKNSKFINVYEAMREK